MPSRRGTPDCPDNQKRRDAPRDQVLEPSAGTGNILRAIGSGPDKVAVELNADCVRSSFIREWFIGKRGLAAAYNRGAGETIKPNTKKDLTH